MSLSVFSGSVHFISVFFNFLSTFRTRSHHDLDKLLKRDRAREDIDLMGKCYFVVFDVITTFFRAWFQ